ncbi:hypothetical protein L3Y34_012867 [Caenorhabditis briggsae]|uniref:Uncharacterized protein n=1 Tax=Caenorhabditis briggsae TaxID=6238 RepID=A0AAE8ZVB8_CAEBR|nr:hypothetical protein L3Y34_012867 [Caenorhabditis briggsae]
MVRTVLLILLFAISSSFSSIWPESQLLKGLRHEFGQSPECSTEVTKFNECVKPHESFIEMFEHEVNNNLELVYHLEAMKEVLKITRNISSCFGHDVQCKLSKVVAFFLEAADFVGSKVYGDAFSCFRDSNIIEIGQSCSEIDEFERGFREMPVNYTILYQKCEEGVLKCAARRLYPTPSCSIGRLVHLYQAFHVGMQSVLLGQQFMNGDPVVLDFDASKYCNNGRNFKH